MNVRAAVASDAPALARLALACPMRGVLTVASVPGPRALAWEQFVGPRTVWIAENDAVPIGSVSLAERFTRLNGSLTRWGYFGELRVLPAARRRGVAIALTQAGLSAERKAGSAYTALVTLGGNRAMERLLARRPDIPRVAPIARMQLIQWLTLRPTRRRATRTGMVVREARESDLPDMHRLLSHSWEDRTLGPALDRDDLAAEWHRDPSLSLADAVVVEQGGALVGCGALWDQRPIRMEIVQRYSLPLAAVASGIRWYAGWRGGSTLPPTGEPLPLGAVRYFAARDVAAATAVRDALLGRARERGMLIVMLGLDVRDPLASVARGYWHVSISATLWAGQAARHTPDVTPLLGRPAYVDFSLV